MRVPAFIAYMMIKNPKYSFINVSNNQYDRHVDIYEPNADIRSRVYRFKWERIEREKELREAAKNGSSDDELEF